MVNAIVGYTGFVGANLLQFYKFDCFYNSKNFKDARNRAFDTVFFCGIPAIKWYANKNPEEDHFIIENIKNILDTVEVNKFILISTIDVYDKVDENLNEDSKINYSENHTYGKNRFLFEEYVKDRYKNHYIIRIPALFGKGLKKNIIYDLIHKNNINDIPLNSSFQWYYLNWLKTDIEVIFKHNIRVCNLFTEPIHTRDIVEIYKKNYKSDPEFKIEYLKNNPKFIKYNTCTKYNKLFDNDTSYVKTADDIKYGLIDYLNYEKLDKSQLCVSNICANNINQLQFACLLKLYGIHKVQIAPTKLISSWEEINNINFDIFTQNKLEIYSLQSIVYNLNQLNIFDNNTRDDLYNHLIKIINCADKNNIKVLVFGCPRNRKVIDPNIDNDSIFINFFKKIGDYCSNKNVIICLENNSKIYNCNYINKIKECAILVRQINKKNIKMMVDLGNALMEKDDFYYLNEYSDIIYNVDVSHENMNDLSIIHEANYIFKFVLDRIQYNKTINLEMLINTNNADEELEKICISLINFITIYSNIA